MDAAPAAPYAPPPMTPMTTPTRPTGVTILAVLAIVGGILGILFGLLATVMLAAMGAFFAMFLGPLALLGAGLGIALVLLSVAWLATGYGYLKGLSWSWYAGLVLMAISALMALSSIFTGDFGSAIIGLAVDGFVIWYLLSPPVQRWFKVSQNVPWQYPPAFA